MMLKKMKYIFGVGKKWFRSVFFFFSHLGFWWLSKILIKIFYYEFLIEMTNGRIRFHNL